MIPFAPGFMARFAQPTDEHFGSVSLLLHMDNDFSDSSSNSFSPTTSGGIATSSAQSVFGGKSGAFGAGKKVSYSSTPGNTAFALSAGDYTIEAWIRLTSTGDLSMIVDCRDVWAATENMYFAVTFAGKLQILQGSTTCTGATTLSTNTWYHVAAARSGSSLKIFLDGTSDFSGTLGTAASTDLPCAIGGTANTVQYTETAFYGYIDELRITKGVARYTSNFTKPSESFPDS